MTDVLELPTGTIDQHGARIAPRVPPDPRTDWGDFLYTVKFACGGDRGAIAHLADAHKSYPAGSAPEGGARMVKAALAEGSGPTGGFTVPAAYDSRLINVAAPISIVRPRATIVPFPKSRSIMLPYLDQTVTPATGTSALIGNIALTWSAEGTPLTESDPQFRQVELVSHSLTGNFIASMELDEDTSPTMDVITAQLFARARAWAEDYYFLTGNGVAKPQGVMNAPATTSVTRNTSSHFNATDVGAMLKKAHPNSLNAGTLVWVIHPSVLPDVIAMLNWQPAAPLQLAGFPIKVSEHCSTLGTAGDVLLCDFAHYLIGEKRESIVAVSPHPRFTTAQDVYKMTYRLDGQPWLSAAITLSNGTDTVSPFVKLS